jgi:chromosomal replication initiator protein
LIDMQLVFDFPVNPKFSFENFVVCSGNDAAFSFAKLLLTDDTKNLLFIHGPAGSGKTHLLRALAGAFCSRQGRATLPTISFKDIDDIYRGDYPAEAVSKLGERFLDEPALLIDDIHLLPDNPHVRSEFWQLFNDFHDTSRKIAITGLYPPRETPHLDDHIVSRLLWGLLAKMDISNDDSLRMIMKKLAEDRSIHLPAEVIDYLLLHIRRELPPLIAALERIHRHSLSTSRRISLRLAREILQV